MIIKVLTGACLAVCTYTDIRKREIDLRIILLFASAGLLLQIWSRQMGLLDMAGGAFIGISLVLMSVITRGKIGLGDGLMLTVTGLMLGFSDNLKILTMSVLLTAGFSVILMIFGKCRKDTELPFAPFLLGAFLVTV